MALRLSVTLASRLVERSGVSLNHDGWPETWPSKGNRQRARSTHQDRSKRNSQYAIDLVEKIQILEKLASHYTLSGVCLRVFIAVLASVNSVTGLSWLGYDKLAKRANTTKRSAIRSVNMLVDMGILLVVKRGGGARYSSRLAVNKALLLNLTNPLPPILNSDEMVTSDHLPIINGDRMVIPRGDEMITSDHLPIINGDRMVIPRGDEMVTSDHLPIINGDRTVIPRGDEMITANSDETVTQSIYLSIDPSIHHHFVPLPDHHPDKQQPDDDEHSYAKTPLLSPATPRYPVFWVALEQSVTEADITEAEWILDRLIAQGHQLADIVAGAQRYARYCKAKGSPWIEFKPQLWLRAKHWCQPWTCQETIALDQVDSQRRHAEIERVMRIEGLCQQEAMALLDHSHTARLNPAWSEWQQRITMHHKAYQSALNTFYDHNGGAIRFHALKQGIKNILNHKPSCPNCDVAQERYCAEAQSLLNASQEAQRQLGDRQAEEPTKFLTNRQVNQSDAHESQ